jgi:hypothetical protein
VIQEKLQGVNCEIRKESVKNHVSFVDVVTTCRICMWLLHPAGLLVSGRSLPVSICNPTAVVAQTQFFVVVLVPVFRFSLSSLSLLFLLFKFDIFSE